MSEANWGKVGLQDIEPATAYLIPATNDHVGHKPPLWQNDEGKMLLPLGELCLLNGHGGLAKSTILCWVAARITRGELPGIYFGTPKFVIMDLREDDWHAITVPRLKAAGADMDKIFRSMVASEGIATRPEYPLHAKAMARIAAMNNVALYCTDTMASTVSSKLSPEKRKDVYEAMLPLMDAMREANVTTLGTAHNKKDESNPITALSGAAWRDVARAVLSVTEAPESDGRKLIGLTKCNYGPDDIPARYYRVHPVQVPVNDPRYPFVGFTTTTTIVFGDYVNESLAEVMEQNAGSAKERETSKDCKAWLDGYMNAQPGREAKSTDIFKAARAEGYSPEQCRTAKKKLKITAKQLTGYWVWRLS